MPIEEKLRDRIAALVGEGEQLAHGNQYGQVRNSAHQAECIGWMAAASAATALACPSPEHPYRLGAAQIIADGVGGALGNRRVGEFRAVLERLLKDIADGLLTSVANQARAETLDDLLDQAQEYLDRKELRGSAILATALFEDGLRRICRLYRITDKDVKTDDLISSLARQGHITSVVGKRCRAAAGARNSALHAQWDEITLDDVEPLSG